MEYSDILGNGEEMEEIRDTDFDSVLSGQIATFENMFDGKTEHAENAIDFSDEDELAEEDEEEESGNKDNNDDNDNDNDNDEKEDDDEEDDFMKELQQEAMEGVEKPGQKEETEMNAVLGLGVPGHVGLQDLDFASNSLLDSTKQIGDSDIELSDDDESENIKGETFNKKHINKNDEHDQQQKLISDEERKKRKEEEKRLKEERRAARNKKIVKILFPSFEPGKRMQLQKLFPIIPLEYTYQQPPPVTAPLLPKKTFFEVDDDELTEFKMSTKKLKEYNKLNKRSNNFMPDARIINIQLEEDSQTVETNEPNKRPITKISYDTDLIITTADWDDDKIFNVNDETINLPERKRLKFEASNWEDWVDDDEDVIFEGNLDLDAINLKLDMNDPNLMLIDDSKQHHVKSIHINNDSSIPTTQKLLEQKFSISNDKEYDLLKSNTQIKVRATIGTMNIEHALPAIRLQSPYYQVNPPIKEKRGYHRNKFNVRTNARIFFSKPRTRRRKKDRGKEISEIFKNSTDLTLGDTAPFFLCEYSEEYPVSLSKFGMGTKIINYYRKITDDDNTRPKLPIGETQILGVNDRSPYWNFGFVEKGSMVPTLYNKRARAPLFQHEPLSTDFLLIKSSGGGNGQRFFLRPINYMFTVGQVLPAVEIPGPHSRRTAQLLKHRLKMIAFRRLNASEHTRIAVKDLSEHFPNQSDMQIRQRLKEFMEYQRNGPDQGFWRLKNSDKLLDYDRIRRMLSPDDVCILDVMMSGQQKFDDLDMFRRERLQSTDDKKDKPENNQDETISQQAAPWNTTRNFIQATQGKAMIQVHGDGDPSKTGQPLTFLKISMKGGFNKNLENSSKGGTPINISHTPSSNNTYSTTAQQRLYEDQIRRAWYKQANNLSKYRNTDKPRIVELDELSDSRLMINANKVVDEEVNEKPRYIKITRMVKNSYGIKERKVQIVKDPKVVELYVKKKQEQLLQSSGNADNNMVIITNDEEENMKVKKLLEEELAKLEKQAEKKKKKQPGITAANIDSEGRLSGKGIGKGKSTSRRCATCGSLGHIRTNKTCPLYYTIHNKSNPNYIPGTETPQELIQSTVKPQPGK